MSNTHKTVEVFECFWCSAFVKVPVAPDEGCSVSCGHCQHWYTFVDGAWERMRTI